MDEVGVDEVERGRSPLALVADSVRCSLRRRVVLDEVSFTVDEPSLVLLGGANGAGKSTLLRCIAGLTAHDGAIEVAGAAWRPGWRGGAPVAYLHQDPGFPGSFTVEGMLEYQCFLSAVAATDVAERVTDAVDALGLGPLRHRRLRKLSGGERRLAFVAGTLVSRAPVLLLDEPSAGLDALHRAQLREALRVEAMRSVVLVSSHALDDYELLADRIVYLAGGRVAFDGTASRFVGLADRGTEGPGAIEAAIRSIEEQADSGDPR